MYNLGQSQNCVFHVTIKASSEELGLSLIFFPHHVAKEDDCKSRCDSEKQAWDTAGPQTLQAHEVTHSVPAKATISVTKRQSAYSR